MKSMPLLFMTFVFLITTACNDANKSLTDLPVIQQAFDVELFNDRPAKGTKAIIYKVTTPFKKGMRGSDQINYLKYKSK